MGRHRREVKAGRSWPEARLALDLCQWVGGAGGMAQKGKPTGTVAEVFWTFLRLGCTSFGGPVVHLGYFRTECVDRRGWLSDAEYADLVALCQVLPGPASSQLGFALGLRRAGPLGALAAFVGFTLPSALVLLGFALGVGSLTGPVAVGALHGLKIVAVAVVAQAVLGMARTLCPDRQTAAIAVAAVIALAAFPSGMGMIGAIGLGAIAGLVTGRAGETAPTGTASLSLHRWVGGAALALFATGLIALPLLADRAEVWAVADAYYRSGALVFGGGHVVLPLLDAAVVQPGWVSDADFLAGYGAAQAVPGPLFTLSAYLGAVSTAGPGGVAGAALALCAIFLPGFLILIGVLPFWDRLRQVAQVRRALRGINAAVVGILGAALNDPVFTGSVGGMADFALALALFVALTVWKCPAWLAVLAGALGGIVLAVA